TRTTEQTNLTTFGERTDQVDNLDTGFQQFVGSSQFVVSRSFTVNRHTLGFANRTFFVDRVTQNVHDKTQSFLTNRYGYRSVGVGYFQTAAQTFGTAHRDGTYNAVAQLLLHFKCNFAAFDGQCIINTRYIFPRELYVDNCTDNLYDTTATHVRFLLSIPDLQTG